MRHATARIAAAVATPFRLRRESDWFWWRQTQAALLLALQLLLLVVGAAVASVVLTPLILALGIVEGYRRLAHPAAPRRPLLLR